MCDILIALPGATTSGNVVFAKNSDRPAGECQVLFDSRDDDTASRNTIRCAFVEVPQVPSRLRTIGCRPYWCWGYETGFNEAGVVGGNTAVFTRPLHLSDNQDAFGLTGMELLRLGLERAESAERAVTVIAELLERYGQWAPAVVAKPPPDGCYDNAFLLADRSEAWILETAGRRWAARRITAGVDSLSNELTIRNQWSRGSDDLLEYAVREGWWNVVDGPLDFAFAYSDHERYPRQVSHIRWRRTQDLLAKHAGDIDVGIMMQCLRDHYEDTFLDGPQFTEYLPDFLTLCMHDSPAGFTWGNTATSIVMEINPDDPQSSVCWSCYQPPCAGVYIAFSMESGLPAPLTTAGTAGVRSESPLQVPIDDFSQDSLWWRMYRVIARVSRSPEKRRPAVRALFDPIEKRYRTRVQSLLSGEPGDRARRMRRITEEQLTDVDAALLHLERDWAHENR